MSYTWTTPFLNLRTHAVYQSSSIPLFYVSEWAEHSPHRIRQMQPEITWRPPQVYLHYNELYVGIFEYLRAPPNKQYEADALTYLSDIRRNNIYPFSANAHYIQNHRILWIQEWLKALPYDSGECSDAETVTHSAEYEEVW